MATFSPWHWLIVLGLVVLLPVLVFWLVSLAFPNARDVLIQLYRTYIGVLAGLATMFVVIMGIEYVGHMVYPPPPGLNPMVTEDLAAIMASQPVAAKLFVVAAWVVGAFTGGWVAATISRRWPRAAAIIVALVVMSGVVGMIFQLPDHPRWMAILGLLLPIPAALFAVHRARSRVLTAKG